MTYTAMNTVLHIVQTLFDNTEVFTEVLSRTINHMRYSLGKCDCLILVLQLLSHGQWKMHGQWLCTCDISLDEEHKFPVPKLVIHLLSALCIVQAGRQKKFKWTPARLFFTSVQNHHVVTLLHHFFHWKKYSFLFFSKHILLSASWFNNFYTRALDKSSRIIHVEKCFPNYVQRDPFSTEFSHNSHIMALRMAAVVYAFSCFK